MAVKTTKAPKGKELIFPKTIGFGGDYGLLDEIKETGAEHILQNPLRSELWMFLRGGSHLFKDLKTPNPKGRPKEVHFWNAVHMLWNYPGSPQPAHMHPWAVRMVRNLCRYKRLSIAGCASSGKSRTLAIWGIVNFLARPTDTKVIFTSTSLKDSRGRIWGDVEKLWQALPADGPGQLVSSSGTIRFYDHATDIKDDTRGLTLLAGEKSKETDSIGKMKGFKAPRMIFIADELPDLSEALISAAESNLSSNPHFQFVGIGNPASYYDPHGVLSEPEKGWASVTERDMEWRGKKAYVIRFDAEQSPNFGPDGEKWKYLMTEERLQDLKSRLGENSLRYYAMVKGFWFPETASDCIYSGVMLNTYRAQEKAVFKGGFQKVAGFDPAFTHGGDDAVLTIGKVGVDVDGKVVVERSATHLLYEDTKDNTLSRSEQIALQVKRICEQEGVRPEDLAVDASGGGSPWCDMLSAKWTNAFTRVQFGGVAENKEEYANRVSELWFSGQSLVRAGQLRGVDNELARELIARTYKLNGKRIQVTPKEEMRAKIGRSPDRADSFFLMLWMAKKKHKLVSVERPGNLKPGQPDPVKQKFRKLTSIYDVA